MECRLCPRNCGTDRSTAARGSCGMPEEIYIARVAPHFWEEPCLSGEKGSGTVFFTGCNLRCVYCQNVKIAAGRVGKPYTTAELAEAFLRLQEAGCHNINLVTPSHYVPQIAKALRLAKQDGLSLPVVYNTSSYDCVQTLRQIDGLVDIYLADLKYMSTELSQKYSHAPDYPETAKAAIKEMVRQTGGAVYRVREAVKEDGEGLAGCSKKNAVQENPAKREAAAAAREGKRAGLQQKTESRIIKNAEEYPDGALMERGVIVRHLLLPGQEEEAKKVISYLYETYGNKIAISILNQYTPMAGSKEFPELNRRVTDEEYERVVDFAVKLGVEHGFLQEGETATESFIPEFEGDLSQLESNLQLR